MEERQSLSPPTAQELQSLLDIYVRELWDFWKLDLREQVRDAGYNYRTWQAVELPETPTVEYMRRLEWMLERNKWPRDVTDRLRDLFDLENEIRMGVREYIRAVQKTKAGAQAAGDIMHSGGGGGDGGGVLL